MVCPFGPGRRPGRRPRDWSVRTVTRTELTANSSHFLLRAELEARKDEKRVHSDNRGYVALPALS